MAVLCQLWIWLPAPISIVGVLVVRRTAARQDPFLRRITGEVLSLILVGVVIFSLLIVSFVLNWRAAAAVFALVWVAYFVYALIVGVIGAVKAWRGESWSYPVNLRLGPHGAIHVRARRASFVAVSGGETPGTGAIDDRRMDTPPSTSASVTGVRVTTRFHKRAVVYAMAHPKLVVDGGPAEPRPWGETLVPLPPGAHTLRCYFRYLYHGHAGDAAIEIVVPETGVLAVTYTAPPNFAFRAGKWSVDAAADDAV